MRYDVVYTARGVTIEPHFCREWDESGGCFGTNPDHGLTYSDACEEVAQWHERQAKEWRDKTRYTAGWYL